MKPKLTPFEKRAHKKNIIDMVNTIENNGLEIRAYCQACDAVFSVVDAMMHLRHREENKKIKAFHNGDN